MAQSLAFFSSSRDIFSFDRRLNLSPEARKAKVIPLRTVQSQLHEYHGSDHDHNHDPGARGGAVVTALASRDRRLRVRSRTLPRVGHPATVASPEVGGPNGETAVNSPKRIC